MFITSKVNVLNDYITGDRLAKLARVAYTGNNPNMLRLVKTSNTVWCKTDYIEDALEAISERKKPCKLITHNSDISINYSSDRKFKNVSKWYAANLEKPHPQIKPVPLGCENPRSPRGYSGNMDVVHKMLKWHTKRSILCLMNFNQGTNPERQQIIENFKNEPYIRNVAYGITFKNAMRLTKQSKFVLCPEGNGIDTHRVWESVYLGAIPIVKRRYLFEEFAKTVPILIVDDWRDVKKEFLEKKYAEMIHKDYTYENASIKFYQREFVL